MNVLDFCLKIDNVIPDIICDELVRILEESDKKSRLDRSGYPNWTNLFINDYHDGEVIQNKIDDQSQSILLAYQKYVGEYGKFFNSNDVRYEGANIKCYEGGTEDRYGYHADVSSMSVSLRYLAMIWYLNDDFDGGETVFYPDCVVKPKKGSVLVFPPFWMFPHCGKPVLEGKKYIMSTYCLWSNG